MKKSQEKKPWIVFLICLGLVTALVLFFGYHFWFKYEQARSSISVPELASNSGPSEVAKNFVILSSVGRFDEAQALVAQESEVPSVAQYEPGKLKKEMEKLYNEIPVNVSASNFYATHSGTLEVAVSYSISRGNNEYLLDGDGQTMVYSLIQNEVGEWKICFAYIPQA